MRSRRLKPLFGFLTWWAGLFALLAGGSVCPCCGTPTCPGGAGSAGILSGLVAVPLFVPRWVRRLLGRHARRSGNPAPQPHACCVHETSGQ